MTGRYVQLSVLQSLAHLPASVTTPSHRSDTAGYQAAAYCGEENASVWGDRLGELMPKLFLSTGSLHHRQIMLYRLVHHAHRATLPATGAAAASKAWISRPAHAITRRALIERTGGGVRH